MYDSCTITPVKKTAHLIKTNCIRAVLTQSLRLLTGVDEVVNAERAEALLYLASYYKEQGFLTQAELLCSR